MPIATAGIDVQFGPYRLKQRERSVTGPAGALELSVRYFDILNLMLSRPAEIVSKDEIFSAVWPGVVVEENTLQVHISGLRKVLGVGMIATAHGKGYRYAGPEPVKAGRPLLRRAGIERNEGLSAMV